MAVYRESTDSPGNGSGPSTRVRRGQVNLPSPLQSAPVSFHPACSAHPFGFLLDGLVLTFAAMLRLWRHPAPPAAAADLCLREVGDLLPRHFACRAAAYEVPHESLLLTLPISLIFS
jgi:hypothetical protein